MVGKQVRSDRDDCDDRDDELIISELSCWGGAFGGSCWGEENDRKLGEIRLLTMRKALLFAIMKGR